MVRSSLDAFVKRSEAIAREVLEGVRGGERSTVVDVHNTGGVDGNRADGAVSGTNAIGRNIRVGGDLFRVIGVYKPRPNIFSGGAQNWAVVPPPSAAIRRRAGG